MTQQEQYLKAAVDAAKKAGITFKKNFGKPKNVQMKNDDFRNLVTEVDKGIENQIRKTIVKKFPAHKIIGEEYSKDETGKNDLVWIIDPIDGTTNYIQGIPFCCISIALWDNKGPLVAALYNPILNQLFTASRGGGAKLNSRPIKVSKEYRLLHALGGVGWMNAQQGIGLFSIMAKNCRKLRVLASHALQICLVASGNYDFFVTDNVNIWDFAAAILVLTEAGGKVTDMDGGEVSLLTKKMITTNGKLQTQIIAKLKDRD
ncbi:MAG: inositol monophosphatase family protein [Candidatus Doudnabacteria bacterium]|nr:inositol monophosphatase family protein [Candidatus Doudnabacteria bacterium]